MLKEEKATVAKKRVKYLLHKTSLKKKFKLARLDNERRHYKIIKWRDTKLKKFIEEDKHLKLHFNKIEWQDEYHKDLW